MSATAADLGAVLAALKELELARLARVARKKNDISQQIGRLNDARYGFGLGPGAAADMSPVRLAGVGDTWNRWIDAKIRAQNMELARLAARFEEQKSRSQLALGRENAFDRILLRKSKNRPGQLKRGY